MSASQALLCTLLWGYFGITLRVCEWQNSGLHTNEDTKLSHLLIHFSQTIKIMFDGCKSHNPLSLISILFSISYWFLTCHANESIFLVFFHLFLLVGVLQCIYQIFFGVLSISSFCKLPLWPTDSAFQMSNLKNTFLFHSPRLCSLKYIRVSLSKLKVSVIFPSCAPAKVAHDNFDKCWLRITHKSWLVYTHLLWFIKTINLGVN